MRKLEELTELEIKDLSYDEIELLIKLRKAEEGVKFVTRPVEPAYAEVAEPDITVYSCKILGDSILFGDIKDVNDAVLLLQKITKKYKLDYNYNKTGSDKKYASSDLEKGLYSGETLYDIKSQRVYSVELYDKVADMIKSNDKLKKQYEKDLKEYQTSVDDAKWIESEIKDKVQEVQSKYQKLADYVICFKRDYLPLADNDENIAIKFMDRAYSLTEEQYDYILINYKDVK